MIYGITLAPGLTWANRGADGGDLITAAATFGVAHPPGYPTYLALARLFQLLPFGSLAFRTNLFSAVCAALAAWLVGDITARSKPEASRLSQAAGLIAGFAFGTAPLVWSQAVITEVYALHALCAALALRLLLLDDDSMPARRGWLDWLGGVGFGLALGNHLTIALLLPPWLLSGALRPLHWQSLARRLGGLAIGSLVYLSLPLRAVSGSPVNWGNPATWDGFWWLVSGQAYQERVFSLPLAYVLPRLQAWAGLLVAQFGLPALAVMLYGLFFKRAIRPRLFWSALWIMPAFSLFAIGYNSPDSYAYLIPAFLAAALWLGWGIEGVLESISRRAAGLVPLTVVAFLLFFFARGGLNLPGVDASQDADGRAETFGRTVLNAAPAKALLFTRQDEETFALWYFHFALRQRPDIVALNESLLAFDWYRETLRTVYPQLILPDRAADWRTAIIEANQRPVCEVGPAIPGMLACAFSSGGLH